MYCFGDLVTQNRKVFLIHDQPCHSKEELLAAYADAASSVTLSGPTSFAPIIHEAVDVCRLRGKYHILIVIADGLMDDVQETVDAIVYASKYRISPGSCRYVRSRLKPGTAQTALHLQCIVQ